MVVYQGDFQALIADKASHACESKASRSKYLPLLCCADAVGVRDWTDVTQRDKGDRTRNSEVDPSNQYDERKMLRLPVGGVTLML